MNMECILGRLQELVEPYEKVSYRFFPTSKEVGNLAYTLQKESAVHNDDWMNVDASIFEWIEKDMVIFHQRYNPGHEDPEKQPFVLVIQTKWMRELAMSITPNSAWAIDSTFKTNQYGLPLYAAMCPNTRMLGMPIFLMLCSADVDKGHEVVALRLTLKAIFEKMGQVRPNAIVIDKSKTEYNAFKYIIDRDEACWENSETGRIQTKCHLLLCWFHVKKAWIEHLIPKVIEAKRNHLYNAMCELLECLREEDFNKKYEDFKLKYADEKSVLTYVATGWAGVECIWRCMWPRYSRLYQHGYMNTTNLVERLWHYIKYTLLRKKVNRRLDTLVWAIIGK